MTDDLEGRLLFWKAATTEAWKLLSKEQRQKMVKAIADARHGQSPGYSEALWQFQRENPIR